MCNHITFMMVLCAVFVIIHGVIAAWSFYSRKTVFGALYAVAAVASLALLVYAPYMECRISDCTVSGPSVSIGCCENIDVNEGVDVNENADANTNELEELMRVGAKGLQKYVEVFREEIFNYNRRTLTIMKAVVDLSSGNIEEYRVAIESARTSMAERVVEMLWKLYFRDTNNVPKVNQTYRVDLIK